jgi:hypothetical protein
LRWREDRLRLRRARNRKAEEEQVEAKVKKDEATDLSLCSLPQP